MDKTQTKRNYGHFLGSFVVMLLIGFVLGVSLTWIAKPSASSGDVLVQMSIDYGDGQVQSLPQDIVPSGTHLETYISLVSSRHGVPFDVRNINGLTYVEAIHGTHSTQESPWVYTVFDSPPERNITEHSISNDDVIVWSR